MRPAIHALPHEQRYTIRDRSSEPHHGERILLCSDGLYNMVSDAELAEIVSRENGLPEKCKALIDLANSHGGTDNITMILAECSGPGLPPADAGAAVQGKEFNEEDFKPQT